jgi:hypothetical protein
MLAGVTTPWIPPRPTAEILRVDPALIPEYMAWFVNRRAYTRQSDNPNADNGRYYYFQPKERLTRKRLALDDATVRKHLSGIQTILARNAEAGHPAQAELRMTGLPKWMRE